MNWFTGILLYVLIWWVALFAVLPIGTQPVADAEETPGGWRGAPETPNLLRKALITTIVAAIIWAGCYLLIRSDWISFRSGWWALPTD